MGFKQSKTFMNLQTVFGAECKSFAKYSMYAAKAKEDGFEQIGEIFAQTAGNELEHAKIRFKLINEADDLPYTSDNLKEAEICENYENRVMYKHFAAVAKEEGYRKIADLLEKIGRTEAAHERRFAALAMNMDTAKVFYKDDKKIWVCRNCGYETYDWHSREKCPVCGADQGFSQIKPENY